MMNGSTKKLVKKFTSPLALGACALLAALLWQGPAASAEEAVVIAAPTLDEAASPAHSATAIFAGGCFWGVQGVFQHARGVCSAVSGYAGGKASTASYEMVGSGRSGHAEAVRVMYDPAKISYGKLLQIFFSVAHNPTELNRQGPDSGTQYRSAVFPINAEQRKVAEAYITQLNGAHVFKAPLATRVEEYSGFYAAEAYHQNYLTLNPNNPYIVINDLPKVANLKRIAPALYRDDPVLVR